MESYKLLEEVKYDVENYEKINKKYLDLIKDKAVVEDLISRVNKLKLSIEKYKPTDKTILLQSSKFFVRYSYIYRKTYRTALNIKPDNYSWG